MNQPVQEEDDAVARLAQQLRELRIREGKPSIARLVELTDRQGPEALPRSTIQDKLTGKTALTSVEQLLSLVRAFAAHAAELGSPLPAADTDESFWREALYTVQRARLDPGRRRHRAGRGAAAPETAPQPGPQPRISPPPKPVDDRTLKKIDSLVDELVNFRSTPEQLHYIGHTLVACEVFLDEHGIADQQATALIDSLSDDLVHDGLMFGPIISIRSVRALIKRLREIRTALAARER